MRCLREGGDAALLHLVEENLRFLAELRSKGRSVARGGPLGRCVSRPADVYELVRPEMEHLLQEQVRVVLLDTRCRVLDVVLVYQGNVSSVNFRAAEVLREAVITNAPSLVLAHNHPSGDPEPSPPDIALTKELVKAGEILGIEVADHVIVGRDAFVSLKERKFLG
ncbi:MAG: JAB domain-containing protein [Dehalococcoidia bacterium]|nr:JAB domain-containing protein [Dehalococcoidia bacterium]